MIDDKKYWDLVAAFRERPGSIRHASKVTGTARETANRAWSKGWPRLKREPIQVIIEREMAEERSLKKAREMAIRTETEAFAAAIRGDVRSQAYDEYERTGAYIKAATVTATSALVEAQKLVPVIRDLVDMAPEFVAKVREGLDESGMSAEKAMRLLDRIAVFAKTVTAATYAATQQGARVVDVQRTRNADLQQAMINAQSVAAEPVSAEEAQRLAAELSEAALEVQAALQGAPQLTVMPGGVVMMDEGEEGTE